MSPHCEQRIAWIPLRGTSLAARLIPASSETEVLFDDLAVPLVVGVQPAANRLGRKASIRERTDERPSWPQHGPVSEHLYGSGEVVDGNAADHGVEGLVGNGNRGSALRSWTTLAPAEGFASSSSAFNPSTVRRGWRGVEVRDPRTHQIEHVSGNPEFLIEGADRTDGMLVDVGDQARPRVEHRIGGRVSPVEEAWREWHAVHPLRPLVAGDAPSGDEGRAAGGSFSWSPRPLLCQVLGTNPYGRFGHVPPYPGRMSNRLDQTRYPNLASIEAKEFRLGLKGYSVREVYQFCRLWSSRYELCSLRLIQQRAKSLVLGHERRRSLDSAD